MKTEKYFPERKADILANIHSLYMQLKESKTLQDLYDNLDNLLDGTEYELGELEALMNED